MGLNKFEQLKLLESKKKRYEEFFIERKGYDYVFLSRFPHMQKPFFEVDENTKRSRPIATVIGTPDEIGLKKLIDDAIEKDYDRICKKFNELQKDL